MADFKRLDVFNLAHALTLDLYRLTAEFPAIERFGLVAQIRRAAVSIGANLAEGSARSRKEFARYIGIALGSANELEYLLQVASDLGFLADNSPLDRSAQVSRKLVRLRQSVTS
jgi:four helix bundle protein